MIASLACETNIAPSALLAEEPEMLQAMLDYMQWRTREQNKQNKKWRR